jgi:hypothetical protein
VAARTISIVFYVGGNPIELGLYVVSVNDGLPPAGLFGLVFQTGGGRVDQRGNDRRRGRSRKAIAQV